jgi:hypothetical protein
LRHSGRRQHRHFHRVQPLEAPLAGHVELPDRLDFVAEEFDPYRLAPVGGKQVQYAAAVRELAGELDGTRGVKAALDQPAAQSVQIDALAELQLAGALGQRLLRLNRLQQALDAGDDEATRSARVSRPRRSCRPQVSHSRASQLLQQPQPLAVGLVLDDPFPQGDFPGGKLLDRRSGEQVEVGRQFVRVVLGRADDHDGTAGPAVQCRRDQRAGRAPDSVERGGVPSLEGRHAWREAFPVKQTAIKLPHPLGCRSIGNQGRHGRGILAGRAATTRAKQERQVACRNDQ